MFGPRDQKTKGFIQPAETHAFFVGFFLSLVAMGDTILMNRYKTDIWREPNLVSNIADVMVAPKDVEAFSAKLEAHEIPFSVLVEDVQELDDAARVRGNGGFHEDYHTVEELIDFINGLAADHPEIASIFTIGTTSFGREITGIRIHAKAEAETDAPGIMIHGGHHAREWVAPAAIAYTVDFLVNGYGSDDEATAAVDGVEWWFVPVVNADGYAYTWSDDRMWRKTRTENPGSRCVGTDPNRNWDDHWGGAGATDNPCSEIYGGAAPFDQPEPKAVADFVASKANMRGYSDFHAYSQLLMCPWGWTSDKPEDYDRFMNILTPAAKDIKALHGKKYKAGPISTTIYPAAGSSVDYIYAKTTAWAAIAIEGRDTGRHGFILPPDQIIPQGEEIWMLFRQMAKAVQTEWTEQSAISVVRPM